MSNEMVYVMMDEENNYVSGEDLLIIKGGKVVATKSRKYLTNGYYYNSILELAQKELAELNLLNKRHQLHKTFRMVGLDRVKRHEVLRQENKEGPTTFPESRNFYEWAIIKTPIKKVVKKAQEE